MPYMTSLANIWTPFDLADVSPGRFLAFSTEVTCIESLVYDVEAVTLLLLKSVSSNSSLSLCFHVGWTPNLTKQPVNFSISIAFLTSAFLLKWTIMHANGQ